MDTPEARAGTTIYLGVNVEGALFSIGDGHYTMGEGEVCGVAVEGAMDTLLTVDVAQGRLLRLAPPRGRRVDHGRRLVAAARGCLPHRPHPAHWLDLRRDRAVEMDTYQLVTQASRSPIANVCDANYTIVAKMPKRYLPAGRRLDGRYASPGCATWPPRSAPPANTRRARSPVGD